MRNKTIKVKTGDRVLTTDGIGTVINIAIGPFPFYVKLDNGGMAWQDVWHIISIIK